MGIGVQGQLDRRVPQHLLHYLRVLACGQKIVAQLCRLTDRERAFCLGYIANRFKASAAYKAVAPAATERRPAASPRAG